MFSELIKKNRSRRVYNREKVSFEILEQLIGDCRYSASTVNRQDIRYILVNDEQICDDIFNITNLPTTHKVSMGNRPSAFIVLTVDQEIKIPESYLYYNLGIATANLTLSASSRGYSCVTLLSTNMEKLAKFISLNNNMKAVSVIAVGKSDQKVRVEDIDQGDIGYYKEGDVHIVPKLTAKALILREI